MQEIKKLGEERLPEGEVVEMAGMSKFD